MSSTRHVAVAATGHQALRAGLSVAQDGGNAVDAALAAAFVALATEPGMVSIAGGCFVNVWPADGDPVVVDGNVEMPGRGLSPDRFGAGVREVVTEYGGGVTMHVGPGSVATPGIVPAFARAHADHARLDWSRLLAPAVSAARDGYPMSHAAARYLSLAGDSLFALDEEARALTSRTDGSPLAGGEQAANRPLADVLEQLGRDGADLFRDGAVGRALVAQMAADGGLDTAEDLAAYTPVVRPAAVVDLGDWRLALNPPPAVGGPMLAAMLASLGDRDAWDWADAIEIQRAVLGYRHEVHDFSRDLEADGFDLLARIDVHGLSALRGSSSTVHVSAADSDGGACAITMSAGYGAGLVVPGTGILLNNCLGEVELNRHGLHEAPPGTRLASNMAPTTGRTDDGRTLAIGSPGADRITTSLMLVLGQGCLHGADLQEAINRPRLHLRRVPGPDGPDGTDGGFVVEHEPDDELAAAVAASGLPSRAYDAPHMYFGGVGAAYRSSTGLLQAAGDARREAAVGISG
jgi:gamma-glutamyltranspeptidase/glutathione hydrolase